MDAQITIKTLDESLGGVLNRAMNTDANPAITYNVITQFLDTLELVAATGLTADMLSSYLELVMPRVVDGRMILLSVRID